MKKMLLLALALVLLASLVPMSVSAKRQSRAAAQTPKCSAAIAPVFDGSGNFAYWQIFLSYPGDNYVRLYYLDFLVFWMSDTPTVNVPKLIYDNGDPAQYDFSDVLEFKNPPHRIEIKFHDIYDKGMWMTIPICN